MDFVHYNVLVKFSFRPHKAGNGNSYAHPLPAHVQRTTAAVTHT